MNLEEEVNRIINSIDPTWNELEIVRFVYIEVGKIVEKNSEFFFTQSNKLQRNALSEEEMAKINNVTKKTLEEKEEWYRVICRSAGILLKMIYDKLNIPSHLIKTTAYSPLTPESNKKVYHWILSVDINNTHYALTLTADLQNIKNGFSTERFATPLPYRDYMGAQVYQGEELDFTVLKPEELEIIDKKIGYINTSYGRISKESETYNDYALNQIKNKLKNNTWYYEIITKKLPIYRNMFTIIDGNGNRSNITSLDNREIFTLYADQLIENVCIEVERAIKATYGLNLPTLKYKNYEDWLEAICVFLEDDLIDTYGEDNRSIIEVSDNFDYKTWRKNQKGVLKCPYKSYDDNLELLDQIDTYVNMIRSIKEAYKNGEPTEKDKEKIKNIRKLHMVICEHFMPDLTVFEKNIEIVEGKPYIKSDYINEKFKTMFPLIFDTNRDPQTFNELGYSEQIGTFNKIIPCIFPEVTVANCNAAPTYTRACKPSLNRIRTYCILNEKTGNYELIIHIPSFFEFEDEFYYLYKLKENTFQQIDIIEDINNSKHYEILSSTLKNKFKQSRKAAYSNRFDDIEDVEAIGRPYLF